MKHFIRFIKGTLLSMISFILMEISFDLLEINNEFKFIIGVELMVLTCYIVGLLMEYFNKNIK